jgi:LysR family glycine cleavage system transcriptional activator
MVAVCSPEFLKRVGGVQRPQDLFGLPLLDYADECWQRWVAAAGFHKVPPLRGPVARMPTQQMQGSAAVAGQGIALVTPELFDPELKSGRLIQILPVVVSHKDSSYWLVYPEERQNIAKIRAFRDWILAEVAKDRRAQDRPAPRLAIM